MSLKVTIETVELPVKDLKNFHVPMILALWKFWILSPVKKVQCAWGFYKKSPVKLLSTLDKFQNGIVTGFFFTGKKHRSFSLKAVYHFLGDFSISCSVLHKIHRIMKKVSRNLMPSDPPTNQATSPQNFLCFICQV